jgi:hypothetical protein
MKVKISSIVDNQFPEFLRNESPLLVEIVKQYFISQEVKGASVDLITNLDEYTKVENLTNQIKSTTLLGDTSFDDSTLIVDSTIGFPESYGLLKIDSEIITYTSKTETEFNGCVRGFSGIYNDQFEFATSESDFHSADSIVENLSIIFLQKLLEKIKKQLIPGFQGREFTDSLNQTVFIQKSKSFYTSKGTDTSFEILFNALYGEPVKVIRPRDYLFTPSSAEYRVSKDLVVESLFGDPLSLENGTLLQDDVNGNNIAKGSISKVEQILRGEKTYYVISLDYDFNKDINVSGSVFGEFYIHAKTKITSDVFADSDTIDVDSTVGFKNSGSLLIDNEVISYTNKSITQFLGCTNITKNYLKGVDVLVNDFAYGYSGNTAIAVRISGVINSFKEIEVANNLSVGDDIRIKSLGKTNTDIRAQKWLYNIPVSYEIKSAVLLDSIASKYEIETFDDNIISAGDSIDIVYKDGSIISAFILSRLNEKSFIIQGQGSLSVSSINYIERRISKANFTGFPEISSATTNVQNVYSNEEDIFVAAASLPTYFGEAINVADGSLTITENVTGSSISKEDHGFLTGDVVIYSFSGSNNHLGIPKGTYYIKRNSNSSISLATSRSNLVSNSLINFSGSALSGQSTLAYNDLSAKALKNQKLIRKIPVPALSTDSTETPIGNIGILNNGVEICNYKSKDVVFYGPVQSLDVVSPGLDYDIINPPTIITTDSIASGLVADCEVKGALKEIRILDRGLNFSEEPSVQISGGNGEGATAKVELGLFEHYATFESSSIVSNNISFINYHGFNAAEKVIYKPDGISRVIGITTDSEYFTSNVNDFSLKLHKTYDDAISGINTISISYNGYAKHRLVSAQAKTKISEIVVTDPGKNYTNRKVSVHSSGITTTNNTINKIDHGFRTGEKIVYESYSGTPIVGISTNTPYYVTAEKDSFKLSEVAEVGINTTQDFFFRTNQYVSLTSSGIGTHYFNYEPIRVQLTSNSGIGTTVSILSAKIQPIFRGEITSVSVVNGGTKYGQEDILNYNRQPNISIFSGSGAIVQAIVANGKIIQILIIEPGSGYYAPPEILINGTGKNAKLTPVIQNGQLIDVVIVNPGYGYDSRNIALTVLAAGSGGQLRTNAKQWTINKIERLLYSEQIAPDDGLLTSSINSNYELEYVHGYAPRKLRQILTSTKYVSGNLVYQPDLLLSNNVEIASDAHSPILGWAYDGNPIYGPYGFDEETGGSIRYMKSGYELNVDQINRPTNALYPEGIFVEDFAFLGEGDLDEHNGRFCVTPEFPNGTYAYFSTIAGDSVQSVGIFANFFRPVFPYFIGKTYKSVPSEFNFNYHSNQDDIDLNETDWLRNTNPFKLNSQNSSYNYLFKPFDIIEQSANVDSIITGTVDGVLIKSSGNNYKVNDRVVFQNELTGGSGARAIVSELKGKEISVVSVASTSFFNVEFSPYTQKGIVGISTIPINFNSGDIVSISNVNNNKKLLEKSFTASISKNTLILNEDVDVVALSGITTYFNVYGDLSDSAIKENDIYQIDSEKVKILNVEEDSSRIFVERSVYGTVGAYHTTGGFLNEIPRRFYLESIKTQEFINPIFNRENYFNPKESIGIGIGSTVIFSNPGIGITNIFIPTRSIYLPEHDLKTGEKLTYKPNGGSNIVVSTDGITTTILPNNSTVYVAKYSDNFIGLSTEKVGIGSTGTFVGYNTTAAAKILYYHSFGSGEKHSLSTNYDSTIGQVDGNVATVYTTSNPELLQNDTVIVSATPNTLKTVKVVYNSFRKLLLVNPRTFNGSNVDITNDTITIPNHGYFTGKKILYKSDTPIAGLINNGLYYIVVKNSITVSLCESFYNSQLENPKVINLSSQNGGTLYEVNPQIKVTKNQSLVFDLSDPSLSVLEGSQLISAFDFKVFFDSTFNNEFKSTFASSSFNAVKVGRIGIDINAELTLSYDSSVPKELYYNLIPLKSLELDVDTENNQLSNTIVYTNSAYSGTHTVSGVGTTSFSYNLTTYPEQNQYTGNVTYTTTSKNTTGPIEKIFVTYGGSSYKSLPGISSIISENGSGAIVEVNSTTIGKINHVTINDIGYDYPSDLTLTPLTQTPLVLKVIPQSSLKSIKIVSQGRNYLQSPDLILLDGLTLKQVADVDLRYNLGDTEVRIVKNSRGINNIKPILVPVNNTNSIKILSFTYNSETKEVTAVLSDSYSSLEEFPFKVGDKILVENVSILADSLAKGFNSSSYDYSRFVITSVTPNIGFSEGSVTYSLSEYLNENEYPGTPDPAYVTGTITPESFFPTFDVTLSKNIFLEGETISSGDSSGIVQTWNSENELLTISTNDEFKSGYLIAGSGSFSSGNIDKIYDFKSKFLIKSSSDVRKGWNTEKGFIDNEFQHLPDNDYYQNFSYSLKSKIDYSTWGNAVSSLNHTAGFKKFADLEVESIATSGITTSQEDSVADLIINLDSEIDLNCIDDFDLVAENSYSIDNILNSNEIYFKSKIIQDYSELVGNRVLLIDDISSNFDGINKDFILKSNNLDVFLREFTSSDIDIDENIINNNNHYFVNGEKVLYSYESEPIGINTTNISGIGLTDKLPSEVYIIKRSESTFSFAESAENALFDVPVSLKITNVGIGTSHTLTAYNQNSKVMMTLGGIIQSPISPTSIITQLSSNVGISSTTLFLNNIHDFSSGSFAKIDDEVIKIVSIGIGTTSQIPIERGLVGTVATAHTSGTFVYKLSGDYNIVSNTLHFVEPPKGPTPIGTTTSPENVDYVGITTVLDFTGRVFLRNGEPNGMQSAYATNYVFDDISNSFNGITTSFILKTNGDDILGIENNNASVLIGEVFQSPSDFGGIIKTYGAYTLDETSGITSIRFLSSSEPKEYDANISNIPVGGSIVSLGYTSGTGLQPLVSAGGTILVSVSGTIQSVSIGNSGSGYRPGIQTVNVFAYDSSRNLNSNIGIASILNGNIVSVAITNPGTGYTSSNPPVVRFDDPIPYDNMDLIYYSSQGFQPPEPPSGDLTVSSWVIQFDAAEEPYLLQEPVITTTETSSTITLYYDGALVDDLMGYYVSFAVSYTGTINDISVQCLIDDQSYPGVMGFFSQEQSPGLLIINFSNELPPLTAPQEFTLSITVSSIAPSGPGDFEASWVQFGAGSEDDYILQLPTFVVTETTNEMTLYYDGALIDELGFYSLIFFLYFFNNTIEDISIQCIIDDQSYPDAFQISIGGDFPLTDSAVSISVDAIDFPTLTDPQELKIIITATRSIPNAPMGFSFNDGPMIFNFNNQGFQTAGIGTGGKANVKVGMDSNIIDIDIVNRGFAYKKGDILTIRSGGNIGIPTMVSSFSPVEILVDEIYNQKFSGWTFGQLQIFDPIEQIFNGTRKLFPLRVDNELKSLRTRVGSPINVSATFLIFINGVLQIPGSNYNMFGGSYIVFNEAPKFGCSCLILFYRGNGISDVIDVEVMSPVKPGDSAKINDDNGYNENERIISSIISADSVETIPYPGPNVVDDINYLRPVKICLQTEDIFINNKEVTKDREIYEPYIEPTTNIIKTVGISSNIIFVESAKTFFDDQRENATNAYRNKLKIISQEETRVAIATAIVSIAGTVSEVSIVDIGKGYFTNPILTFSNPPGFTTEYRAQATATVSNGSISSITIVSPGSNYSRIEPPQVLISNPLNKFENVTASSISGDFGIITGVSTAIVGVATSALSFNLFIPTDSPLRNSSITGTSTTVSGIQTGYYFVVKNSFIGNGTTSLEENGSTLSIGSSFIDNIYRVTSVSIGQTFVSGIGLTAVAKVTTTVTDNNIVGIGFTKIYGTYSWGRIVTQPRITNNEFVVYNTGISGLSSAPIIKRINSLKSKNYS